MSNNNTSGSSSTDDGIVRIPAQADSQVKSFRPANSARQVRSLALAHGATLSDAANTDWYLIDLNGLNLPDGVYEYEFVLDGRETNPSPTRSPMRLRVSAATVAFSELLADSAGAMRFPGTASSPMA